MEIFKEIKEFYQLAKFSDLKLVSGLDNDEIMCHCIIISSAVPGFKDVLIEHSLTSEETIALVFPEIQGSVLREIVTDIYSALDQDDHVEISRIESWAEALGTPFDLETSSFHDAEAGTKSSSVFGDVVEPVRNSRRKIKRRRFSSIDDDDVDDSDFEVSKAKKTSQGMKRRSTGRKPAQSERTKATFKAQQVDIKEELDDIDTWIESFVNDEEGVVDDVGVDADVEAVLSVKKRRVSGDDGQQKIILEKFSDWLQNGENKLNQLLKTESSETEMEQELSDFVLPQFDETPVQTGQVQFRDLESLSGAINKGGQEQFFEGTTSGVYLQDGFRTFIPDRNTSNHNTEDPQTIPVIPTSSFVAIFAIAVRNALNLAKPVALLHKFFPTHRVVHNFVTMIRRLTGVSTRSILESRRHRPPPKEADAEKRVKKIFSRVRELTDDERDLIFLENERYIDRQNETTKLLSRGHIPTFASVQKIKFKIVDFFDDENDDDVMPIDYVIVHGNDINALVVQTFAKPVKSTLAGIENRLNDLIDAMAAFCRLKSASELHKITTFKNLIENHFDRVCETITIKVLNETPSAPPQQQQPSSIATRTRTTTPRMKPKTMESKAETRARQHQKLAEYLNRKRSGKCPDCRQLFDLATPAERKFFEEHKMSHVGCTCDIAFASDAHYRAHMKSVHILKKKFKCEFGSCNQHFHSQHALEKHFRRIHEKSLEDGVGVICAICGQTFVNQHYLRAHHLCYHKEIQCQQCGEVIVGKNAHEKHHRDVHATFDDHLCQHCGKGFKLKKYLHIHIINSHTAKQDKPFPCHLCEKGFNNHMKLTQHLDGVHYKRKPYKCRVGSDICSMAFSAQSTRKRHEKVAHKLDIRMPQGRKSTSKVTQGSELEKNL